MCMVCGSDADEVLPASPGDVEQATIPDIAIASGLGFRGRACGGGGWDRRGESVKWRRSPDARPRATRVAEAQNEMIMQN